MNPFYNTKNKRLWTFNRWNWLWLWLFPTYVAFSENTNEPFAVFYKVVGTKLYIVGQEDL